MRRWGLAITFFYALALLILVVPASLYFLAGFDDLSSFLEHVVRAYAMWGTWAALAIPIIGEALLLLLPVDTTRKRLKPRTHIVVSAVTTGLFLTLLVVGIFFSILFLFKGDKAPQIFNGNPLAWLGGGSLFLWVLWAVVFARVSRDSTDPVTLAVKWLLRGSVLELLIAVPAHVITRRRHDCSAPIVTGFGISSGLAIMLLAFGPSVYLLYKKRIDDRITKAMAGR